MLRPRPSLRSWAGYLITVAVISVIALSQEGEDRYIRANIGDELVIPISTRSHGQNEEVEMSTRLHGPNELPEMEAYEIKQPTHRVHQKPLSSVEAEKFPDISQDIPQLLPRHCRIYLCNHGESSAEKEGKIQGMQDSYLTEKGSLEAEALGLYLRNAPIQLIGSSTLTRSSSTADRIQEWHPQAHRRLEEKLCEIGLGKFEGKVLNDTEQNVWAATMQKWATGDTQTKLPGDYAESLQEVEARVLGTLLNFGAWGGNVLGFSHFCVVGHPIVNRIILAGMLNKNISHTRNLSQERGCVSIFDISLLDGTCRTRGINLTPHLHHKLPTVLTGHHEATVRLQKGEGLTYCERWIALLDKRDRGEITAEECDKLEKDLLS